MTNLTRKNQKVFASGASNNGQFGSLQAETKVLSNDVETLQALAAYESGWNSAVVSGEQLPSLEEFQALNYINTYQIGYLLQKGFPEWNTDTTYYIGDLAREVGGTKIYKSITDSNSGNALVEGANWTLIGDLSSLAQASTSEAGTVELLTNAEMQAGADTERAATAAAIASAVLGFGQSWQDVTGSRAVSTTYTNTTGRPIQVAVSLSIANTNTATNLIVGGVIASSTDGYGAGTYQYDISAIVPNGFSYSVSGGSPTLFSWRELR